MMGYDFDRQRPIDKYIADFYCKDLMLAIEIDGETHIGKKEYDMKRQKKLERLGVSILRFDDLDVRQNLDGVVKKITNWIENNAPESPKDSIPGRLSTTHTTQV